MLWWRRSSVQVKESVDAVELLRAVSKLQARVDALEDQLQALDAMYKKLRGRLYARWGRADDDPQGATPRDTSRLSKDQLRAQLTLSGRTMPGRPVQHD